MNLREVVNIDFNDSSYMSCQASEDKLIIHVESWDNRLIEITFFNPVYFIYQAGSFGSGFYEKLDCDSLLNDLLHRYFHVIPEKNPFKAYVLLDIDDNEIFRIVAEDVSAVKNNEILCCSNN